MASRSVTDSLAILIVCLGALPSASACQPSATDAIRVAAEALPDSRADCTYSFREGGLRNAYCYVREFFDVSKLQALAGIPIFVEGPHGDALVLDDPNAFGHYNPQFVRWVIDAALPEGAQSARVFDGIFENYLEPIASTYLGTLYILEANPEFFERETAAYRAKVERGERVSLVNDYDWLSGRDSLVDDFHVLGGSAASHSAYGFWMRRSMDGTLPLFKEGLERMFEIYAPKVLTLYRAVDFKHRDFLPPERRLALSHTGRYLSPDVAFETLNVVALVEDGDTGASSLTPGTVSLREHANDCAPITEIAWDGNGVPLVFLQGPIEAGPVQRAPPDCSFGKGEPCTLEFLERRYELSADNFAEEGDYFAVSDEPQELVRTFDLHITSEGISQTIHHVVAVEWMGDLDRDGRLDVFLRVYSPYCEGWALFLSSERSERNLFLRLAEFLPACPCCPC